MHFLGGLANIGSVQGPSTLVGRPVFQTIRVRAGQTITTLAWAHNPHILIQQYERGGFASGKGEYIVRLPPRPRYHGAKVVYPYTYAGYTVMVDAGKASVNPPGTTPFGNLSGPAMVLDDTAVAGVQLDRTAITKGIGAGPSISPVTSRATTTAPTPAKSEPIATADVRAAQARQNDEATKAEARDATLAKWGPPVAVVGVAAVIGLLLFMRGRKKR